VAIKVIKYLRINLVKELRKIEIQGLVEAY
jgi:hypothetical protein